MSLGDAIRRLREAKGWSQERLAREAGVSWSTVSRLERDALKQPPQWDTVCSLADALGVSRDRLPRYRGG